MQVDRWLRLSGTRYRCVPLYQPVDQFDPLARLFLHVLKYESDVSRLVRAFGLTERVVEDVLGDLVRRNRALLVIKDDRVGIRLLDRATPNILHEPGEILNIWQDHATGVILPSFVVDPFEVHHAERGHQQHPLTISGAALIDDFLEAADAQLIEMLLRSDESLRQRDEQYDTIDRLSERYRVRPQSIWLPVVEANIQGQTIPLIIAEDFPSWVTRVWSVALRRGELEDPSAEVQFHAAATTSDEGFRLVHSWRIGTRVGAWRTAVYEFLMLTPPPVSGYDLRSVRAKHTALAGFLQSAGEVDLIESNAGLAWLRYLIRQARDWALVVLPWPGQLRQLTAVIRAMLDASETIPRTLVIVGPFSQAKTNTDATALKELLGPTAFVTLIDRPWPIDGPCLALTDTAEVRFRAVPDSSVLRFSGDAWVAEWLGMVQSFPAAGTSNSNGSVASDAREVLRQLKVPRHTTSDGDVNELPSESQTGAVAKLMDGLRAFSNDLMTAIVDPDLLRRSFHGDTTDEMLPAANLDKQRPLAEQLPFLFQRCEDLCHDLSVALTAPLSLWSPLGPHDIVPTLVAVLTEPRRSPVESSIYILSPTRVSGEQITAVGNLIKQAVGECGWVINLGLPASPSTDAHAMDLAEALKNLTQDVSSPRFRVFLLSKTPPAHALVLNDLVFIAVGGWLPALTRQRETDFGFAIESAVLAESLRTYFTNTRQIV